MWGDLLKYEELVEWCCNFGSVEREPLLTARSVWIGEALRWTGGPLLSSLLNEGSSLVSALLSDMLLLKIIMFYCKRYANWIPSVWMIFLLSLTNSVSLCLSWIWTLLTISLRTSISISLLLISLYVSNADWSAVDSILRIWYLSYFTRACNYAFYTYKLGSSFDVRSRIRSSPVFNEVFIWSNC